MANFSRMTRRNFLYTAGASAAGISAFLKCTPSSVAASDE